MRSLRATVVALLVVVLLCMISVPAFAATGSDTQAMNLTISSVSTQPEGTVQITLDISNNPGLTAMKFYVEYDAYLTLTDVQLGTEFGSNITTPQPYTNPQPITMISPLADNTGNGRIATLTFTVAANAPDGHTAKVGIRYDAEDIYNSDDELIALHCDSGSVYVYHKLPGDLNEDGKVNGKDAVALFRYVADWPEEVDVDALDYNGDSKINTKDAVDLFRYTAGWEGIVGHRHVHKLVFTEGVAATCAESGNIAYYHCANCNKYYTDAEGEKQIPLADTVVPAINHVGFMEAAEAKAATCTEDGNTAYWYCAKCDKYFGDAQGKTVIEQSSTVLIAKGHAMTKVTENAATCTQTGNITYWHCNTCGKDFLEESGKTEIKIDDTVIEATGHVTKSIAAKEATCTEDGNIAYWQCVNCSLYFGDEKATQQIQLADTIVPAKGHGAALKKIERNEPTIEATGNEAYWKCEVCGKCYSDQAAKNEIEESTTVIPAKSSYVIIFKDDKNHPDGKAVNFAVDEYVELASPSEYDPPAVPGYEFKGWYTSKTYAESNLVDNIPKNSKQEGGVTTLYAKWDTIPYTITYKNAADNSNPLDYTVEDEITLADPKWTGLKFSHWIDENGETVTKIKKGTTGKLVLEACWIYAQNYAVTSESKKPIFVIKPDDAENNKELYYMVYEVGTVYNVPMDYISPAYRYDGTAEYSQTYSKTLNVGEDSAQSAARSTGSSYVKTSSFTSSVEMIKESSKTKDKNFNVCPEIEAEGVKVKLFEYEKGKSNTVTETTATTESSDTGISLGGEVTEELAHSISYYYDISTSVSETLTLSPGTSPAGSYRLAWVSDYRVYAIVTYDAKTGDYGMNIYSMALGNAKRTLYELLPEYNMDVKIARYDSLNYEIPVKPAEGETGDVSGFAQNIVNASFYVTYDANGGTGTQMPMSVGNADGTVKLLNNTYSKTGWHFIGWDYAHGETVGFISGDGSTITNPLGEGDTLVLKAHWETNSYSVTYDANGGSGTTVTSKHTYDTASVLTTNGFSRTGYTFLGWSTDKTATAATYANKASVKNLTSAKGGTVKLYAVWKANSYTVYFDANGGTVDTLSKPVVYDSVYGTLPEPTRGSDYHFAGWYLNGTEIEEKSTLETAANPTLVAKWVKIKATVGYYSREIPIGSHPEAYYPGFNRQDLLDEGFQTFQLTITIHGDAKSGWKPNNDPLVRIYSHEDALLHQEGLDRFRNVDGWSTRVIKKDISIRDDVASDGSFWIKYTNEGANDWILGTVEITITAIQ